jgi:hypothetical protein
LKWLTNIFKSNKPSEKPKSDSKIDFTKITNYWNADPVSPEIELEVVGNDLTMEIFVNYLVFDNFNEGDKAKITFKNCSKYSLNICNDEGYYYGQYRTNPNKLPWGEFYEIIKGLDRNFPDPIVNLQDDNTNKRHFIFFFKDETFECLASDFSTEFNTERNSESNENQSYKILLEGQEIGTTQLEKADAPMGVVFGNISFTKTNIGYDFIKEYCKSNGIELTSDYPEDKLISTRTIEQLTVKNDLGTEIKGIGNQISGMDSEGFEITLEGIPYPFYEEEFPYHVKEYNEMFKEK